MLSRVRFVVRQVAYDLRTGLLFRPAIITLTLTALAAATVELERRSPSVASLSARWPRLLHVEAGTAQAILATIAGSMMAVVSIVFSMMMVALSLASMQFSPRILSGFVRDRVSQTTMGLFVGTFVACLWILRAIQGAFVPALGVALALVLALVSLGWLIYFIHHIAESIQANHIVDRIARETQEVMNAMFPELGPARGLGEEEHEEVPPGPGPCESVASQTSGYVQLVDEESLLELARAHGVRIDTVRMVGEFATEGTPLVTVAPATSLTPLLRQECVDAFDLGPVRTMQSDVEFGFRKIVDIALKAISPAVNDPSTAVTCIDHLGRLLTGFAARTMPASVVRDDEHVRLVLRRSSFARLSDLAFHQIRQYGKGDMAVCLRILKVLGDVALTTRNRAHLDRLLEHGRLVEHACAGSFPNEDRAELDSRWSRLQRLTRPDSSDQSVS